MREQMYKLILYKEQLTHHTTFPSSLENPPGEVANRDDRLFAELTAAAATRSRLRGRPGVWSWSSAAGVALFALSSTNVPRTREQSGASWVKRMSLVASALRCTYIAWVRHACVTRTSEQGGTEDKRGRERGRVGKTAATPG